VPRVLKNSSFAGIPCSNITCSREAISRKPGAPVCNKHYQRWLRYGEWSSPDKVVVVVCGVDGCENPPQSKYTSLCAKHRARRDRGTELIREDESNHCLYCGEPLVKSGSGYQHKYCSAKCNTRDFRGSPKVVTCKVCGVDFVPDQNQRLCSDQCVKARRVEVQKQCYDRNFDKMEVRNRARQDEFVRRAKRYGVEWIKFDLRTIFDAAEGRCQICGEEIEFDKRWPDPRSPSIDHIIPMSAGGKHVPKNCQATHLRCNLVKAQTEDVQMAAKCKRRAGETGQYARRQRAKEEGTHRPIAGRGFAGSRKFNGEVTWKTK